jgi:purine-nucleoside phosphorylase
MSDNYLNLIHDSANYLRSKGLENIDVGIVLGTGLSQFVNEIDIISEIPYAEIPGFSAATVEFHPGKLIYGSVAGKKVLAMNGRYHYYEGYNMQEITLPIRVMKLLGINNLFLSNAAGGMDLSWKKGDLMLITDHINLQSSNPLIGKNLADFGPRFPDMSQAYNKKLITNFNISAKKNNIVLRNGVYVSVMGSMLESPAEYRFLRKIGADAVGMSTVPEVIVANHMSMNVAAISVITDECDPDNLQPINIPEIIEIAGKAEKKLSVLLKEVIATL